MLFIGDVHGKFPEYLSLIKGKEHSIQLGDFGFQDSWSNLKYISEKHKVLRGNHDVPCDTPHNLGDFGEYKGVWFMRGALSVDKNLRIEGVNWWASEELTYSECNQAITSYEKFKPLIVISHDCPSVIKRMLIGDSTDITSRCLQACLDIHTPSIWVFAHHHVSWSKNYNGCEFMCLNELETVDF